MNEQEMIKQRREEQKRYQEEQRKKREAEKQEKLEKFHGGFGKRTQKTEKNPEGWVACDFETTTIDKTKPTITPILPNLFSIPAIIPDIAYAATIIGSDAVITPKVTPIVTPAVVPISIPFFQPNNKTINMLKIFVIENP